MIYEANKPSETKGSKRDMFAHLKGVPRNEEKQHKYNRNVCIAYCDSTQNERALQRRRLPTPLFGFRLFCFG
jgi:hypothetical protein